VSITTVPSPSMTLRQGQGLLPLLRSDDAATGVFQVDPDHISDLRVIFHNKDRIEQSYHAVSITGAVSLNNLGDLSFLADRLNLEKMKR